MKLLGVSDEAANEEILAVEEARDVAVSELVLLLSWYGVPAMPLSGAPAVLADLPAALVVPVAQELEVGRVGWANDMVIPTAETFTETTGAEEVHGWGWTGSGRKLGIVLADKPSATSCLSFAGRRWLVTTSSVEAKVGLGSVKQTCTPEVSGVAPGVSLYSADPLESGGCDGACRGTFTSVQTVISVPELLTTNVVVADVDQYGALDVAMPGVHTSFYGGGESGTRLYLGDGAGGFSDASALIPEDPELHAFVLRPCDVDGDGDLDLVEAGKRKSGLYPVERRPRILLNQVQPGQPWTLAFTEADPISWGLPELARVHELACADLDDDGDNDLLLARQQPAKNVLLRNTGAGAFADASADLPDLGTGADGFDYLYQTEVTQSIAACFLEDAPEVATLFYANGKITSRTWQSNAVMRPAPDGHYGSAHLDLGFRFDTLYGLTEDIVCADLDGNGRTDAVFVANTGARDHLYRFIGGAP